MFVCDIVLIMHSFLVEEALRIFFCTECYQIIEMWSAEENILKSLLLESKTYLLVTDSDSCEAEFKTE